MKPLAKKKMYVKFMFVMIFSHALCFPAGGWRGGGVRARGGTRGRDEYFRDNVSVGKTPTDLTTGKVTSGIFVWFSVHDMIECGQFLPCTTINMDGWVGGRAGGWAGGWVGGRVDGWIHGWTDSWMDGFMDSWMDGFMDGRIHGRTDGRTDGRRTGRDGTDGRAGGWMDSWMDSWIDSWMDSWMGGWVGGGVGGWGVCGWVGGGRAGGRMDVIFVQTLNESQL